MIAVAANAADLDMAAEFFELFKTPWEPFVSGRTYRVVLTTDNRADVDADLVLAYGSATHAADTHAGLAAEAVAGPVNANLEGQSFPVYGDMTLFDANRGTGAVTAGGRSLEYRSQCGPRTIWRVGYDLFSEVRFLLTKGQPVQYAESPTLEQHIAVLRHLLLSSGVSFVEIPPRPSGFDFACCLTHDLDFFGIRRHAFDRTMAGFLVRASVGALADVLRGRRPLSEALRSWAALCSLPLVFLRMVPDFWRPFDDYGRVEKGLRATYFMVPFRGRPGIGPDKAVHAARAVPYGVGEIASEVSRAAAHGNEIAVHGIDAWRDAASGRAEMAEVTAVTAQPRSGIRMHWLYFSDDSPSQLESAGFDYDSTCGYNDAVGYRPGTSQVFRMPGTQRLMELPLSIMDSALFFPDRMGLPREDALQRCRGVVANARHFGGTVVVNWHDRSLAPERLWGAPYEALLKDLRQDDRAWFGTAMETVDWFRWRRSITFDAQTAGHVTVTAPSGPGSLPAAHVCVHRPTTGKASVEQHPFDGAAAMQVVL